MPTSVACVDGDLQAPAAAASAADFLRRLPTGPYSTAVTWRRTRIACWRCAARAVHRTTLHVSASSCAAASLPASRRREHLQRLVSSARLLRDAGELPGVAEQQLPESAAAVAATLQPALAAALLEARRQQEQQGDDDNSGAGAPRARPPHAPEPGLPQRVL